LRFPQYDAALTGFAVKFLVSSGVGPMPFGWNNSRVVDVAVRALCLMSGVIVVEEDTVIQVNALQSQVVDSSLWNLDRVDQRQTKGDGRYFYNATSATVHAYVLDTGIRKSHAEFEGRADWVYNAFSSGSPVNADDQHGHGTHVAGTVGGKTFGLAKEVLLHAIKVLDENGAGSDSTVMAGLDWLARNRQSPAVAVMSLGGPISSTLDRAVKQAVASGVSVVVAAGNSNEDACGTSPAHVDVAITVAAADKSDARASFSNWGSCVTLFAPGVNIKSASFRDDTSSALMSGTSMAAPHVAGAVALYLSRQPGASPAQVKSDLVCYSTKDTISDAAKSPNRALYSLVAKGSPVDDGSASTGSPSTALPTGNNQNEQCTTASPCSGPYEPTLQSSGAREVFAYNTTSSGGVHRAWLSYNLGGGLVGPRANNALYLLRFNDAQAAWETVAVANDATSNKNIYFEDSDGTTPARGASWAWVIEARGATPSTVSFSYKRPEVPAVQPSEPTPSVDDQCSATNYFDPNPDAPNSPGQNPDPSAAGEDGAAQPKHGGASAFVALFLAAAVGLLSLH